MCDMFPQYPTRETRCLDGVWEFCWLGADVRVDDVRPASLAYPEWQAVPGVFDTALARRNARGVGVYRRVVTTAAGTYRLTLEGLGLHGRLYWDGLPSGACELAYTAMDFEFDTTAGRHDLCILVDNRFRPDGPELFHAFADFYAFGGIYRSVVLQRLPEVRMERAAVRTVDLARGRVRLDLETAGLADGEAVFGIGFDGVAESPHRLAVRGNRAAVELEVPGFRVWSPENPHLHTVTVRVGQGDAVVERFGVRTVAARGQEILLNGQPTRLMGANRHESHPDLGPVLPDTLVLDDLKAFKELGANFVRCVHYQQSSRFLDLCDQMGLLVWEESLGWGNPEADARCPETTAMAVRATEFMVRRHINHPSILFWAFLNEGCSDSEDGRRWYGALAAAVRAIDTSRLVTYASNRMERDRCFEFADVISVNIYPGWFAGPEQCHEDCVAQVGPDVARRAAFFDQPALARKPVLVSEIGCCAFWGYHDVGRAQWSEEFQSDYFAEACHAVLGNRRFAGLALWQFCDTRSYVNTGAVRGKPRGMNCAGMLDEYRHPKLAFQTVRDLFARYRAVM